VFLGAIFINFGGKMAILVMVCGQRPSFSFGPRRTEAAWPSFLEYNGSCQPYSVAATLLVSLFVRIEIDVEPLLESFLLS
jgi:hypothetical protein